MLQIQKWQVNYMKISKLIALVSAVVLTSPVLTQNLQLPERSVVYAQADSSVNTEEDMTSDISFTVGRHSLFSDEIVFNWSDPSDTAAAHSQSATITSYEELSLFLKKYLTEQAAASYLKKYDDSFFEKNVLLLHTFIDPYGGRITGHDFSGAVLKGASLQISFTSAVRYAACKTYFFEVMQAAVPKEKFNDYNIEWNNTEVLDEDLIKISFVDADTDELLQFDNIPLSPTIGYLNDDGTITYADTAIIAYSNPDFWEFNYREADIFELDLSDTALPEGYKLADDYKKMTKYENGSADVVFRLKKDSSISRKSTKLTFYDKDTGELIDIPENGENIYLLKCTSGEPYTSEIFNITSNPCTVDSDCVYEESCSYSFHSDTGSGWYHLPEFETISENDGSIELACRMKWTPGGDANEDGIFSISDVVFMQKWLLNADDVKLSDFKAVDFCRDNRIDVFDLVLMRKALLQSVRIPVAVSIEETGTFTYAETIRKVYREDDKFILYYKDLRSDVGPYVMEISEQDYNEIMSQDYDAIINSVIKDPDQYIMYVFEHVLTLTYPDGSAEEKHIPMTNVINKLIDMTEKYMELQNYYVKPAYRCHGPIFHITGKGNKLYSGPDESYNVLAELPPYATQLPELGFQDDHDPWIFTKYNGLYGWLKSTDDNDKSIVVYDQFAAKPVIYLYPEKETDVHVELELTESELYTTYPKYNNGWDVTAYPDGSLLNKADGTHHKYLFWDAANCRTRFDFSSGFCVAGSDTESFLREKLTYMGLTEEEMNEFIVYWLPKMEHNKYNLISFQGDVYTDSAKLDITPSPDSLLRIFMTYIPLEEATDIQPQQLETFERKGFTVVEWGGSEIRS